jgi:hypothetical protein
MASTRFDVRRTIRRIGLVVMVPVVAGSCGTANEVARLGGPAPRLISTSLASNATSIAVSVAQTGLPGQGQIQIIAGNPHGPGVWFWGNESMLLFYDPVADRLSSWNVGMSAIGELPGSLAIDASGNAWLAENQSVEELTTSTGLTRTFTLPGVPSLAASTPLSGLGSHPAQGIATFRSSVAVTMSSASAIEVLDTTTNSFTAVPLPAGQEAEDVAYFSDGTLAASLRDWTTPAGLQNEVLLVTPNGSQRVVNVPEALGLSPSGPNMLVGTVTPSLLSSDGAVVAQGSSVTFAEPAGIGPAGPGAVKSLSDGRLVGVIKNGVTVLPPSTSGPSSVGSLIINFPQTLCGGGPTIGPGLVPGTNTLNPVPTGQTLCPVEPVATAVDGSNNIWIVPSLPAGELDYVPASALS